MFRRTQKSRPTARPLNIESLESRQLLTAVAWDLIPSIKSVNSSRVPQNSPGETLQFGWHIESVSDVGPAEFGTVQLDEYGDVSFTPQAGFLGVDSFEFTGTDWSGNVVTNTVYVNVTESIDALPDWTRIDPGVESVELNVLENDYVYPMWHNPTDAINVTIKSVGQPENGQITINSGGTSLTYIALARFEGVDEFTYTVIDRFGNQSSVTSVVEVTDRAGSEYYSSYEHFFTDRLAAQVERWNYNFGLPPY